jgi:hypothetical protein
MKPEDSWYFYNLILHNPHYYYYKNTKEKVTIKIKLLNCEEEKLYKMRIENRTEA